MNRTWILVATPHFHGLLNTHMNEHTRALVVSDIQKYFSSYEARDIPEN